MFQGKDQCDREAAVFKGYAERWLLTKESNKITTATELLEAIFYNGGPKNTKMAVIKIDKSTQKLSKIKKVENISFYHFVNFSKDGAIYKEYFDIGNGKRIKHSGKYSCLTDL